MERDFYRSGSHNLFFSLCTRKDIKIWRLHITSVSCSLAKKNSCSIVPMCWLALLLNGQTQGKGNFLYLWACLCSHFLLSFTAKGLANTISRQYKKDGWTWGRKRKIPLCCTTVYAKLYLDFLPWLYDGL